MQLWTLGISHPAVAARQAVQAEEAGFDGWACVDSQNLAGDTYVGLALAAAATERVLLGPAVTNPVTRHPAVTAAAIASIQIASRGRAVLGIGRGDSALAHLGLAPAPVRDLERYLATLQRYLRGEGVPFPDLPGGAADVATLELADAPADSTLAFVHGEKVPVEVAATGPLTLEAAARHADRVLLAVGADPDRMAWAADLVRSVNPDVKLGTFVNIACHPDVDLARTLVSGGLSTFARFSVMHGRVHGPATEEQRRVLSQVHGAYDMTHHTQVGSAQASLLSPEFVDRFAVVGSPQACTERLQAIGRLGVDKVVLIGPTTGADPDAARVAHQLLVAEVVPALRGG